MELNNDNYFWYENNMKYFGSSQYKSFSKCEAAAMAELDGEFTREKSVALLVGSYVDAFYEGSLDKFKENNPEIFSKNGSLKSDYIKAEAIIERLSRDEMFSRYMSGEKQVIKTGNWLGVDWKIKIDSYHEGTAIVDLKVMKDFAPIWVEGQGKIPFVEAWGYDIQAAIYQAIEGNNLPFFIAGATKEKETDLAIYKIPQENIDMAAEIIRSNIERFRDVKQGLTEPIRCEHCDYCKRTKVLKYISDYREIGE